MKHIIIPILVLLNTSSWMYDNRKVIYNKNIYDITFPGTHDSGSYNINGSVYIDMPQKYNDLINIAQHFHIPINSMIKGWARTQNINIKSQLEKGARYLDLRIGFINNIWYIHHDYILGYPLEYVLIQIKDFLIKNQGEIVILELSHIFDLTDERLILLNNTIINVLGDLTYKNKIYNNETIGKLIGSNQRILIVTDTILYLSQSMIYNTWANTPNITDLVKYNDKMMQNWKTTKYNSLFKLSWVLTPNIISFLESILPFNPESLNKMEQQLGNQFNSWSNTYINKSSGKCPIFPNIIIVDFIEKTNITKLVIDSLIKCK